MRAAEHEKAGRGTPEDAGPGVSRSPRPPPSQSGVSAESGFHSESRGHLCAAPPRPPPARLPGREARLALRPRGTGVTDLGPVTLGQRRRPSSTAGPHHTCRLVPGPPRLQATNSPVSSSASHGKRHVGFQYRSSDTPEMQREERPLHGTLRACDVCTGAHTTHVCLSAPTVVWGTRALGRGPSPPAASNVSLTLTIGGSMTPILQTRKLRLSSSERCNSTRRRGLSPRPSLPARRATRPAEKWKTASHRGGRLCPRPLSASKGRPVSRVHGASGHWKQRAFPHRSESA